MLEYQYRSIADILRLGEEYDMSFHEIVEHAEMEKTKKSAEEIQRLLLERLDVFQSSIEQGVSDTTKTPSKMSGGQADELLERRGALLNPLLYKAMAYAIAVTEANAKMYRIVACPTAGSCGILPGAFMAIREELGLTDEQMVKGLLTAAGIGNVITNNATVAGAEGGCQAECGAAAAMAAGGIVTLLGGNSEMVAHAAALALKNVLGLVCDPVAGLVEVPCIKRNGMHAVHAITAAEMALQGLTSMIPADEVIEAMWNIGRAIPAALRETSEGGLAKTKTGIHIAENVANL